MQPHYPCISCGTSTQVDPPTKPIWEDEEKKVPKMGKVCKQCHQTGKVYEIEVPLTQDEKPRTIMVSLRIGHETIHTSFCKMCVEKIRPEFKTLWDKLEGFTGRLGKNASEVS